MIRTVILSLTAVLLAAAVAPGRPVLAQETGVDAYDLAPPDTPPLTAEESDQLAATLQFDAAAARKPVRSLKLPSLSQPASVDVTRSDLPDGSSTYTVKRALPTLDAKVGADLGTGAAASPYYVPDRPITSADRNSGAAWASVDVDSLASVDARVDPTVDQGRLATTLHRSVPIGRHLSLTVQNSSGITQSLSTPSATAPAGLPVMTLPVATDTAAGATQVWDDQPSVKVDVLSTGTSFSAALARNSADPVVHNRIGADQRLYGPLHVNTAVADIGEPTESRSIGAAIKLNW